MDYESLGGPARPPVETEERVDPALWPETMAQLAAVWREGFEAGYSVGTYAVDLAPTNPYGPEEAH